MNNTESSTDITNINYLNSIDKEIIIALIGGVGTICTAFLGFLGVWSSQNFECGCCSKMPPTPTDESEEDEEDPPSVAEAPAPASSPAVVSSPPSQVVHTPPPPYCGPCQILETPLDSFLGIIKVNRSNCYNRRIRCQFCGKHFCTYHLAPNNDGATGGHVCKRYRP